jgi:hypothetical protein
MKYSWLECFKAGAWTAFILYAFHYAGAGREEILICTRGVVRVYIDLLSMS